MTILSVFFEVISPKHTRACSSLKRWPRSLQTARGFQIAWNIYTSWTVESVITWCERHILLHEQISGFTAENLWKNVMIFPSPACFTVMDVSFLFSELKEQCGLAGEQLIAAQNIKDPYTWSRANSGCHNPTTGMSLIKRGTPNFQCLKTLLDRLRALFPPTKYTANANMFFWTGHCTSDTACTYYHLHATGLSVVTGIKENVDLRNRYLLCERGKPLATITE